MGEHFEMQQGTLYTESVPKNDYKKTDKKKQFVLLARISDRTVTDCIHNAVHKSSRVVFLISGRRDVRGRQRNE